MHIDTAPVWEAYHSGCECPVCAIRENVEYSQVDYFLGESVMEPSQRIEVNKKGFCSRHLRMMFEMGNHLGLGLMVHTYMKNTAPELKKIAQEVVKAAQKEAKKSVLAVVTPNRGSSIDQALAPVKEINGRCVLCERLEQNMERYLYTIIYMFKHEAEFKKTFEESKGVCMEHYVALLEMAGKHLIGENLSSFVETLVNVQNNNLDRMEKEIEWFTLKFDYKNQDKPWGTSQDAVQRCVNKIRTTVIVPPRKKKGL